jgi:hypothetical protein
MVYNVTWLLSCTHNVDLVEVNCVITDINDKMTSSLSSVVHYRLLNRDENREYPSYSSSAPMIIYSDDSEDQSNRWGISLITW